jgi:hypothetical protein
LACEKCFIFVKLSIEQERNAAQTVTWASVVTRDCSGAKNRLHVVAPVVEPTGFSAGEASAM